jgi:hypothetical protein
MNRGYLILATTNESLPDSAAYFKQAANLAISLLASDPDSGKIGTKYPIALLHDGRSNLPAQYWQLFDRKIVLKPGDDRIPFYNKTRLFDYSPWEETIYIDSDSLAIGDPDRLFDDLQKYSFASCVVKQAKYATAGKIQMSWVKQVGEIYEYYGLPHDWTFTELNSSLIYWKADDFARDIFTLAEHFYACEFYPEFNGLAPKGVADRGHFPDELAFECAMLHINYTPPALDPFFMQFSNGSPTYQGWTTVNKTFPLMTMPGGYGHSAGLMWTMYDKLRLHFARQLGKVEGNLNRYGQGFKMNDRNKAANKANRERWAGLRERETPERIKGIVKRWTA